MKLIKLLSDKIYECLDAVALLLVAQTANSACIWVAHQPEFPEEANVYKKVQ